jgi:uncharacterized protein YbjT (DUF2867 family)
VNAPLLITGGTGTLGGHVIPLLQAAGQDLRVLSRRDREPREGIAYVRGDLLTGEGVDRAVDGVSTVLHLAGGPKGDDEATRTLVQTAARADVRHLVYISVIGADTVPLGYFRSKRGAEEAVVASGLPWTILRAAQFHDLVLTVAEKMAKLPVVPVPGGLRFQPVDSREVGSRLAELTLGRPSGRVRDVAGPQVYGLGDLVGGYLQARGKRRAMLPVRMPGKAGRAYRAGLNLSLEGVDVGSRSWEEFLAERLAPDRDIRTAGRLAPSDR